MKKKFLSILLVILSAVMLMSACDGNDTPDPFDDPNAGKDQISYIVAIKEPTSTGNTRSTNVSSDKDESLGAALERLGYVKSENGKLTEVFNYSLKTFETPGFDLNWRISINGTETDKDVYSIPPEKDTVYTFEMVFTILDNAD